MLSLVLPVLLCVAGALDDLSPEVKPTLVLWLAPTSVDATRTGHVVRWRDASGGKYVFAPLSSAQHKAAHARWRTAVSKQRARAAAAPPDGVEDAFAAAVRPGSGAVAFPAPLIASSLQLRDGITCFFVVTPRWLHEGDQAVGQRFFGHYPFGQFRFHDGRLGFKTEAGDVLHSYGGLRDGEALVAAYRFDGGVEMAVNGLPFEAGAAAKRGARPRATFSASGYVTLGGCPPHNAFIGDVHEVMIFGVALDDADARHVAEVLGEKHGVALALSDASGAATHEHALPAAHGGDDAAARYRASRSAAPPPMAELLRDVAGAEAPPRDVDVVAARQQANAARLRSAADTHAAYAGIKASREADKYADKSGKGAKPAPQTKGSLLQQLQEAQARMAELQHAVDGTAPADRYGGGAAQPDGLARNGKVNPYRRGPPPEDRYAGGRVHPRGGGAKVAAPAPAAPVQLESVPRLKSAAGACLGGDAFAKISTNRWDPPGNARLEDIQRWQKAKAESDNAIKKFPRGGKELRSYVHDQVDRLRLLRHNVFCNYLNA